MSDQPAPAAFDPAKPVVVDELVALYLARKELGIQRYSVPLQPDNGRDMARDALEEALDLSVYLMGMILELRAALADWKRKANDAAVTLGHNRVATNAVGNEVAKLRRLLVGAALFGGLPDNLMAEIAEAIPGYDKVEV